MHLSPATGDYMLSSNRQNSNEYVPFGQTGASAHDNVKQQARRVREVLEEKYRARSWNTNMWAQEFWQHVSSAHETKGLHPALVGLLQGHGWVGRTTVSPPRVDNLIKELRSFENSAMPSVGASAAVLRAMPVSAATSAEGPTSTAQQAKSMLRSDLQGQRRCATMWTDFSRRKRLGTRRSSRSFSLVPPWSTLRLPRLLRRAIGSKY